MVFNCPLDMLTPSQSVPPHHSGLSCLLFQSQSYISSVQADLIYRNTEVVKLTSTGLCVLLVMVEEEDEEASATMT